NRTTAALRGKIAIANARLAYQDHKARLATPRWQALARRGARQQRVLFASTSTKDPRLSDLHYVEALIGPDTIDTMPPATLDAFLDHGRAEATLETGLEEARLAIDALSRANIDLAEVTARLLDDGVRAFADAFERLVAAIENKREPAPAQARRGLPPKLAE